MIISTTTALLACGLLYYSRRINFTNVVQTESSILKFLLRQDFSRNTASLCSVHISTDASPSFWEAERKEVCRNFPAAHCDRDPKGKWCFINRIPIYFRSPLSLREIGLMSITCHFATPTLCYVDSGLMEPRRLLLSKPQITFWRQLYLYIRLK